MSAGLVLIVIGVLLLFLSPAPALGLALIVGGIVLLIAGQ